MEELKLITGQAVSLSPAEALAEQIAGQNLDLDHLTEAELADLGKLVVLKKLSTKMEQAVDIAGIDLHIDMGVFLSVLKSKQTRRAYEHALVRLEKWCHLHHLKMLALTTQQADEYSLSLKDTLAPNSIRLNISAISSFYEQITRWHENLRNPFHGTKTKPLCQPKKEVLVPTKEEVEKIELNCSASHPVLWAMLSCMIYRGLRASGVANLHIKSGGHFTSFSKGKQIQGLLPDECIRAIKQAGLPLAEPFKGTSAAAIEERIRRFTRKLCNDKIIDNVYHAHCFRHYFACEEYKRTQNPKLIQKLLGHKNLATTDNYLRSLGMEDE
jgi:site-specific recombinase XerD